MPISVCPLGAVTFMLDARTSHTVLLQIRASGALYRADWYDQSTLQLNASYGERFLKLVKW